MQQFDILSEAAGIGIVVLAVVIWHMSSSKIVKGISLAFVFGMAALATFATRLGPSGSSLTLPNGSNISVDTVWKAELAVFTLALGLMVGGSIIEKLTEVLRGPSE